MDAQRVARCERRPRDLSLSRLDVAEASPDSARGSHSPGVFHVREVPVKTMPVTLEQGRATCSEPQHLPLVDAAFAKPGGPEAQEMKRTLCRTCPVAEHCLAWAMTHGEAGVWAGTSPNLRGRRGAPRALPVVPDYLHRGGREGGTPAEQWRRDQRKPAKIGKRQQNAAATRCAELGVREADIRRWAYEHGLATSNKGRASLAHVEAWAAAHQAA